MRRNFATPAAFKASLEDRIRNRAHATATDLQRLRQLVVYDRFLARIFHENPEDVVLKGGLALELRSARARATKDVDLRMVGAPDANLERLQRLGRLDLADYLTFNVLPDPRHPTIDAEGMVYEGRRYRVEASLAGKVFGRPFGTDVAFAEPLIDEPEVLEGEPWLDFVGMPATRVRVYPFGTHVAEKVHAYTLPRPRPNSRIKDLPDLALLAQTRAIRATSLRAALEATFQHRRVQELPALLPPPPDFWPAAYREMAIDQKLPWPDLEVLMTAVRTFIDPVLAGGDGVWDPAAWSWNAAHSS